MLAPCNYGVLVVSILVRNSLGSSHTQHTHLLFQIFQLLCVQFVQSTPVAYSQSLLCGSITHTMNELVGAHYSFE